MTLRFSELSAVNAPRNRVPPLAICLSTAVLQISAMHLLAAGLTLRNFRSLGPGGGGATFSAAYHPSNPDIILVGQDVGGIMKSTDGGRSWRHVNQGGISGPARPADVYGIPSIFFHPSGGGVVFACSWYGLFRSTNDGETWSEVLRTTTPVAALAFSPSNPAIVVAGTGDWHFPDGTGSGVYRSSDGGVTFAQLQAAGLPDDARIGSLAFDPANGALFAATTAGLQRSTNLGDSFTKVNAPFRHDRGQWIGIASASRTFWYVLDTIGSSVASWSGGVYRSNDGVQWTEVSGVPREEPLCEEIARALGAAIDPSDPNVLYLGLRADESCGGLYRYDGVWRDLLAATPNPTYGGGHFAFGPEGLGISSADPRRIAVCTEASVMISDDRGATFRIASIQEAGQGRWKGTGAEVTFAYDIAVRPGVTYAAFEDIGTWKSADDGESWTQMTWTVNETIDGGSELAVHPSDPSRLYIAASSWSASLREAGVSSEIVKSIDGGVTTQTITPPQSSGATRGRPAIAVAWGQTPASDTIYAAFHGGSAYKSSDGGASWVETRTGFTGSDASMIFRIAIDPSNPQRVFAGLSSGDRDFETQGGLYRSDNGGASWQRVSAYPFQDVAALVYEGSPARLFVGGWSSEGTSQGALLVSDDGLTFRQVLAQPFVMDVTSQPGTGALFAAAAARYGPGEGLNAGLYRSTDNGQTWTRIDANLPHHHMLSLHFSATDPNRLFIGTAGDGILSAALSRRARRRPVRRP